MKIDNEDIDLLLSITIETKEGTVEIPISDDNAFQCRSDGIFLNDTFYLWEEIICCLIVNRRFAK